MKLRNMLAKDTKQELIDRVVVYGMKGYSKLKKEELIDSFMEYIETEEVRRSILVCLTEEELDLYCQATKSPVKISVKNIVNATHLSQYELGYIDDEMKCFTLFDERIGEIQLVNDKEFKVENQKKAWMMKCINFFKLFHGVTSAEVFYKMYSQNVNCTIDEMAKILKEIPIFISQVATSSIEEFAADKGFINSPLYSEYFLITNLQLLEDEKYIQLVSVQGDSKFYIPNVKLINEILFYGYEVSAPVYKKIDTFLKTKLRMDDGESKAWGLEIYMASINGDIPLIVVTKMIDFDIDFKNDKTLNEFIKLVNDTPTNTRLIENRGHTLEEIGVDFSATDFPFFAPEYKGIMNALIDDDVINFTEYRKEKEIKIGRNEPCPCGSGKKYKKCCGNN